MKKSIYNSLIYISQKYHLLYNALSDVFVILPNQLKQLWIEDDLNNLSKKNLNFYDCLIKGGFIVDYCVDECYLLKEKLKENIFNENDFHLIINPTLNCNFKCWYCYETHSISKINEDVLERIRKFINNKTLQLELSHFHLSFFGGEPLLYFEDIVAPLIDYTYKKCHDNAKKMSLSFTSNGYLINDFFLNYLNQYHDCYTSVQVTLDGCREDHNKVRYTAKHGSFDVIIQNIKRLLEIGVHVILRINYTTKNINMIDKIITDLSDPIFYNNKLLVINFQQVWQDISSSKNNSECLDKVICNFREHKFRVLYHNSDFVRNPCYADKKNEMIVNYNGNIYKCTAIDFDKEERYGYLNEKGVVIWEENKHQKRLNTLFSNPNCFNCRIAPICGGGCSQNALKNSGVKYCLLNNDEELKDKLILDKFENRFL